MRSYWCPYWFLWVLIVLIRLYKSLYVVMDFNGLVWVFIGPYVSLLVFMGPYSSNCVLMNFNECLLVLIGLYSSLWFEICAIGSLSVVMHRYGS